MKTLAILTVSIMVLLISSCNQNSPAPAPATPAPTPTPTSSMTPTEAALVGDWIFDKNELYSGGTIYYINTPSTHTDYTGTVTTSTIYAGAHMVFKTSLYLNTVTTFTQPQYYNADYYGNSAGGFSLYWQVRPSASGETLWGLAGDPFSGANGGNGNGFYIITLNANTLIYQSWIPGQIPNGFKCYFHK